MDSINQAIAAKITARAEHGARKYGVTMDRQDLTPEQWINHLQEELFDAAVYSEKLLMIVRMLSPLIDGMDLRELALWCKEIRGDGGPDIRFPGIRSCPKCGGEGEAHDKTLVYSNGKRVPFLFCVACRVSFPSGVTVSPDPQKKCICGDDDSGINIDSLGEQWRKGKYTCGCCGGVFVRLERKP